MLHEWSVWRHLNVDDKRTHPQVGSAAVPTRRPRIDQLEAYVQQRSAVAAAAAADAAAAGGNGTEQSAAAAATRASLAAAPLLPGHSLERPAAMAEVEQDLQGALHATVAAATYAHSLGGAAAEEQAVGQELPATTLRLLAPTVDVVTEWLPASETTNAAWLLARAAADGSRAAADIGERESQNKASREPEQPGSQLEGEAGHAALEHAACALASCSEETAGGAVWQVAALRQYMVSVAAVRRTAIICLNTCEGLQSVAELV